MFNCNNFKQKEPYCYRRFCYFAPIQRDGSVDHVIYCRSKLIMKSSVAGWFGQLPYENYCRAPKAVLKTQANNNKKSMTNYGKYF